MNKKCLLVIDVQRGIFERNDPVYEEEKLLNNINTLIEGFRKKKCPLIFIRHESSGMFKRNSTGWQFHQKLDFREHDTVLAKTEGNAFVGTGLDELLKKADVSEVVVCGLLSQVCVQRTLLGALELGYKAVLVSDAHGNSATDPVAQIQKVHKTVVKAGVTLLTLDELSV